MEKMVVSRIGRFAGRAALQWAARGVHSGPGGPTNLPFTKEELQGDDKYSELNNYYSDLFTGEEKTGAVQPEAVDELEEINREHAELFGDPGSITKLSLKQHIADPKPKIFISNIKNPYKNLAIENYIFEHIPVHSGGGFTSQRLLFYTNSPCVVVGKNQNPWKETNFPIINDLHIPLIRRLSGGGTVVHDLGNVNYSYMTSRAEFSREKFGSIVVSEVNKLPLDNPIYQNERGDLMCDGKKLSGSAYKIAKGKSYHHGTMLLNSNLSVLRKFLNRDELSKVTEFKCNSVESVRSSVVNLGIDSSMFIESVSSGFMSEFGACEVVEINEPDLDEDILSVEDKLRSWEHTFGATPKFTVSIKYSSEQYVEFNVEKGFVKSISTSDTNFKYLKQILATQPVKFVGSDIAGFITDDELSEFIGNTIDGTN